MKMPTMDRIMMTSMATASTLMMERTGRCNRFAKISLFIPEDGSEGVQNAGKSLAFRVTAQGWRRPGRREEGRKSPAQGRWTFNLYRSDSEIRSFDKRRGSGH
jgi:hypothetical protein